jgi:hypothetical protein
VNNSRQQHYGYQPVYAKQSHLNNYGQTRPCPETTPLKSAQISQVPKSNMEKYLEVFVQKKASSLANTTDRASSSYSDDSNSILSDNSGSISENKLNNSADSGSKSQESKKSEEEIYEEEFLRDICKVSRQEIIA